MRRARDVRVQRRFHRFLDGHQSGFHHADGFRKAPGIPDGGGFPSSSSDLGFLCLTRWRRKLPQIVDRQEVELSGRILLTEACERHFARLKLPLSAGQKLTTRWKAGANVLFGAIFTLRSTVSYWPGCANRCRPTVPRSATADRGEP